MYFNLKNYQVFKVKQYLKNFSFVFFYNIAKLKSKEWLKTEQNLKILKLNYYKVLNGTTIKILNNSSFKNFNKTISGVVLFVVPKFKLTQINIENFKKQLKPLFVILNIKLNNKIYTEAQIKNVKSFSYKQNVFNFCKSLDKHLKTTHKLTQSKSK